MCFQYDNIKIQKGGDPIPRKPKYIKFDNVKYNTEWQRLNMRAYTFRFNVRTDADIIEQLERQQNKRGYISGLIRDDLKRK